MYINKAVENTGKGKKACEASGGDAVLPRVGKPEPMRAYPIDTW